MIGIGSSNDAPLQQRGKVIAIEMDAAAILYESRFSHIKQCIIQSISRVERDAPCYRVRPPPHRTVRADFPHTALRVEVCIHRSRSPNLFRIVSLWSRRHRSTWTSGLRLAASSADCPSLDVPFPFVIHPLMFYQYSCEL